MLKYGVLYFFFPLSTFFNSYFTCDLEGSLLAIAIKKFPSVKKVKRYAILLTLYSRTGAVKHVPNTMFYETVPNDACAIPPYQLADEPTKPRFQLSDILKAKQLLPVLPAREIFRLLTEK